MSCHRCTVFQSRLEASPMHVWHHSCSSLMALLAHRRAFAAGPFTTNIVSKPDQVCEWWSCQSHHHHHQHHWNDHHLPILITHAHCTSMNLAIWCWRSSHKSSCCFIVNFSSNNWSSLKAYHKFCAKFLIFIDSVKLWNRLLFASCLQG